MMLARGWQRPHEQWWVRRTAVPKLWMVMEAVLEIVGMREQVTMLMGEMAVPGVVLVLG